MIWLLFPADFRDLLKSLVAGSIGLSWVSGLVQFGAAAFCSKNFGFRPILVDRWPIVV